MQYMLDTYYKQETD